jgi:hypothetical protein
VLRLPLAGTQLQSDSAECYSTPFFPFSTTLSGTLSDVSLLEAQLLLSAQGVAQYGHTFHDTSSGFAH